MESVLKIMTCGSVDDGKSTLIGHLLYDAKMLFVDQEKDIELESKAFRILTSKSVLNVLYLLRN